jgi:glycerol-3-phosphate dehydrogenase (NAD(P)+)
MNITILGAGAWGTAMAIHAVKVGQSVTLVPRRFEQALEMASTRENRDYLPGCFLGQNLQIGPEALEPSIMEANVLMFACPVKGLRTWAERVKAAMGSARNLRVALVMCKGLEPITLLRPTQVLEEVLPGIAVGVISGPTYAHEVAEGKPTAVVLASTLSKEENFEIQHALHGAAMRVYPSDDVVGVEMGSALKNIYAIGSGIAHGLGLGDNAAAAYLTRALREMVRLGTAWGGKAETFYGLSGLGDLVATCSGEWSRNRSFGVSIAQGMSVIELMEHRKTVVEGYFSTGCFYEKTRTEGQNAPIVEAVYRVLYEKQSPREALESLMGRPSKESEHI